MVEPPGWNPIAGSTASEAVETDPADEIEAEAEIGVETTTGRALPSWLLSAASAPLGDAPREED